MHGRYMRAPAQEDDRPIRAKTVRRVIGTFKPYRRKVAWVGLAIVVVGCCREPLRTSGSSTTGCSQPAQLLRRPDVSTAPHRVHRRRADDRDPHRHRRDRRGTDLPRELGGPARHAGPPERALFAPAVHAASVLHHDPHRRDPVADRERRRRGAGGVHDTVSNILSKIRRDREHAGRDALLVVAASPCCRCQLPFFLWLTVKVGRARREVATSTAKTYADLTAVTEETLGLGDLAVEVLRRQRTRRPLQDENERLTGCRCARRDRAIVLRDRGQVLLDPRPRLLVGLGDEPGHDGEHDHRGNDRAFQRAAVAPVLYPIGSSCRSRPRSTSMPCSTATSSTGSRPEIEDHSLRVAIPRQVLGSGRAGRRVVPVRDPGGRGRPDRFPRATSSSPTRRRGNGRGVRTLTIEPGSSRRWWPSGAGKTR